MTWNFYDKYPFNSLPLKCIHMLILKHFINDFKLFLFAFLNHTLCGICFTSVLPSWPSSRTCCYLFWYLGYRIFASHCGNWQKKKATSAGVSTEGNLFLREKSKSFPFLKQSKRTFID